MSKQQHREFAIVKKGKEFWCEPVWKTIHILAATLRPGSGQAYKTFLWSLVELLPCDVCRKNLQKKLETIPPDAYVSNNHDAFFYSYVLHDMVNEQINSESENGAELKRSPNFDDVKNFFFASLSQECKDCST